MTKNQKIYVAITGVVIVLALSVQYLMKFSSRTVINDADANLASVIAATGDEKFSGTISAVDTGCFSDAICSVTIDAKKIILSQGGRGLSPDTVVGKLIGVNSIGDLQGQMGAFANVYAALTGTGDYTLYGNSEYFVEVVPTSDK